MANLNFNANDVEPSTGFEIIPAGKYKAQIVNSEMEVTKSGNGQMLKLEFDIVDGQFSGRKLWVRLNLQNPNTQAVEIARRDLSAICHAVGVMALNDSEQLHFKPMTITVKVRPEGNDKNGVWRDAQNEVRGYAPAQGGGAPAVQGQRNPAPAAKGDTPLPPWKRSAA